jgi:hypothetical protein
VIDRLERGPARTSAAGATARDKTAAPAAQPNA